MSKHWSTDDIPDQTGRVAVITGANTGLGYATAVALAARGARVVLAVRDLDRGREALRRLEFAVPGADAALQALDLASLASIRAAAEALRAAYARVDLLINNAGVFTTRHTSTADGFELQFGTNHLGHFALTGLLLDRLLRVPGSRVVTVTSSAHRVGRIRFDDLNWQRGYSSMAAYGQSKLANLLFTYELQRRLTGTGAIAVAAHPGASNTELPRHTPRSLRPLMAVFRLLAQSPAMGALPTLRAATDASVQGGQYFGPSGLGEWRGHPQLVAPGARARDEAVQRRLWALSEQLTGVDFSA